MKSSHYSTDKDQNFNFNYSLPARESKIGKLKNKNYQFTSSVPVSTSSTTYKPIMTSPNRAKYNPSITEPHNSSNDYRRTYDLQSQKIFELTTYKNLCEELITKLLPATKLPITKKYVNELEIKNVDVANATQSSLKIEQLFKEKNEIAAALNKQHVINDQQRNLIEILKQTLESSMIKNNMTLEEIIEASKAETARENRKKEIESYVNTISEIKSENTSLKKIIEDHSNTISLLKEKIENEKSNNVKVMDILSNKEDEKAQLEAKVISLQNQNDSLKQSIADSQSLIAKYENDITEKGLKINEMTNEIASANILQQNYNENKAKLNNLEFEYGRLTKEKNNVNISLSKAKDEIAELKRNLSDTIVKMRESEEMYEKEKIKYLEEIEKNKEKSNKSEIQLNNITGILRERENQIIEMKTADMETEKVLLEVKRENDNLKCKIEEIKAMSETEIGILKEKNEESKALNEKMKSIIEDHQNEISQLNKQGIELKTEMKKILNERDLYQNEKENLKNLLNNANKQYEQKSACYLDAFENLSKLKIENDNLNKEIPFWKNKYNTDMKEKTEEIIHLKNIIDNLTSQVEELVSKNKKIMNENAINIDKNKTLQKELGETQKLLQNNKNNFEISSQTLKQRDKDIKLLEENLSLLSNENYEMKNTVKHLSSKYSNLLEEHEKIDSIVRNEKEKNENLLTSHDNKKRQIESLTTSLNAQYRVIQSIFSSISTENDDSMSPLDKLEFIKSYIADVLFSKRKTEDSIEVLSTDNSVLHNKVHSLEDQLTAYANKIKKTNQYLEDTEDRLKQMYNELVTLKYDNGSLQTRIIILNKEKKFVEEIIGIIISSKKMKKISGVLSQIMDISDEIAKLNRENWNINESERNTINRKISEKSEEFHQLCDLIKKELNSEEDDLDRLYTVGSLRSLSRFNETEIERLNTLPSQDRSNFSRSYTDNRGKFSK